MSVPAVRGAVPHLKKSGRIAGTLGYPYLAMVMTRPGAEVPFTYREYALLPDDGRRHELIEGDFYVTPAPTPVHQTVSRRLQHALMTQLEDTGLAFVFDAPIDVILSDTTVVQPDLAIVRQIRREMISKRGIEGPPDVVVEILSPSSKGQDEFLKKSVYARFGIPEYWLLEPEHGFLSVFRAEACAYRLSSRLDRSSTLTSPEFAEISIPLGPVFRAF
jgi:Uma2 family endonuclease